MVSIVRFEAQGLTSVDLYTDSEDSHGELGRYRVQKYSRAHQVVRTDKYRYRKRTSLILRDKEV